MSRNWAEFDFANHYKPCGQSLTYLKPDPRVACLGTECFLYKYCDLRDKKNPWQEPLKITQS